MMFVGQAVTLVNCDWLNGLVSLQKVVDLGHGCIVLEGGGGLSK